MVETIDYLASNLSDNSELFEMSKADDDLPALATIEAEAAKLGETVEQLEFRRMFNNPADPLNCFIDIQAGAGGTEACDWAAMLLRQYLNRRAAISGRTAALVARNGQALGCPMC